MNLGILAITSGLKDDLVGLVNAAVEQGHSVNVFMMDDGVYYCKDNDIVALSKHDGVSIALCERSCQWRDIEEESIPDGITAGSQLQNSMMHNGADRILVI